MDIARANRPNKGGASKLCTHLALSGN